VPGYAVLVGTAGDPLGIPSGCKTAWASQGIAAGLILAFLLAFNAEWLGGMAAITGAYLAGLFVAATPAREKVAQEIHPMIHSFFGPIFFVSIGLEVNARHLGGRGSNSSYFVVDCDCGKIAGCGLGAFCQRLRQARVSGGLG